MTGQPSFATRLPATPEYPGGPAVRPYPGMVRPASPLAHQLRDLGAIGLVLLFGLLAGDWVASLGLAVLFIGWKYLTREPGPPIVAAVFSLQWLQVMAAVIYLAISGREIGDMRNVNYRPMMLVGLGCVVALFSAFYFAAGFSRFKRYSPGKPNLLPWSTNRIAAIYLATVAGSGVLQELAWSTPGLTQPLLVFSRIRYIFLYFLVTRLISQKMRWPWIAGILFTELMLGFTGFFAEFREPLVVVGIAILGTMDRKRAKTWVLVGSLVALGVMSAIVWTAIKPIIRSNYATTVSRTERLGAALTITGATFTTGAPLWKYHVDAMISRIWAIYFPALALERVPSVLPHENGRIIWGALQNVFAPRMFFPDKAVLPSQSDEVRKYAGVWVAGRETNTSYAFGYAAESYVDFGVPLMFGPIFIWGLLLGFAYRWLSNHIRYHELRTGVTIVVVWTTMAYYEASWVMMIGPAVMILAVLGTGAAAVDRFLREASKKRAPPRPPGRASALMPEPYRLRP
jgi:hypothetical protein